MEQSHPYRVKVRAVADGTDETASASGVTFRHFADVGQSDGAQLHFDNAFSLGFRPIRSAAGPRMESHLLIGGLMLKLDPDKLAPTVLWPARRGASAGILRNTSTAILEGDFVVSLRETTKN